MKSKNEKHLVSADIEQQPKLPEFDKSKRIVIVKSNPKVSNADPLCDLLEQAGFTVIVLKFEHTYLNGDIDVIPL